MERRLITLLGTFDLFAVFDTVDHAILLRRLNVSFGIQGVALNLFGRSPQVSVQYTLTLLMFLEYGMPQGSVLGPVLFLCIVFCILQTLLVWCVILVNAYAAMQMIYR